MKRYNGALAQLVEQWPFKPFVTGSNPVRPIKNMFKKLLFAIYFIPLFSFSQTVSINDELGNKINEDRELAPNKEADITLVIGQNYKELEFYKEMNK